MFGKAFDQVEKFGGSKVQGGTKRMDSPIFKSGDYNFNLIASIW